MLNAKPSKWSLLNYYTRRQSNTKPKMSLIPVEDVIETTETTDSTEPKVTIVKQATPLNSKKRKCEESGKENGKCGPTVKKKKVNCTGKHNTRKNVGRVRIGKSSEFVVETWQYFVHRSNYFTSKISAHTNCGIVADLKRKLTEKQLERFRSSCFGHFLDMSAIVVQNQLIHALLLREVQPPRVKEMWFRVNNTNLRFGIQEFGIITGLKCQGDYHKDYTRKEPNRLMEVYFGGALMVKKRALSECFLENEWDNNDDGLKLAVLYFIHTFLFSTRNDVNQDTNIKKSDFDLVEYGQWETFPWGCKLFDIAWNTMHDKLRGQSKMFRYAGFPLALQLWFYECCPTVDKKLANCVANSIPRILNWKVLKQLSQHELEATLFGLDPNKVVLQNISLSPVECERLDIPQGDEFDIQKDLEHASAYIASLNEKDVVTEVPYRRNHTIVSEVHAAVDVAAELNRLSDGQAKLKDQITSSLDSIFIELGNLAKKVDGDSGDEGQAGMRVAAETDASLKQPQNVDGIDKGQGLATENDTSFEQAVGHQKSVGQFVEAEQSAHQPVEQVVKDGQVHELRVREYAPEEQNMKEAVMPEKIGEKSVTKACRLRLPAKHIKFPFGNKLGSSGTSQIQPELNEEFAATAKCIKAARTFAASTSDPSQTRTVDMKENLAEYKKVVDSGFESLKTYIDTKFIERKKEFDDFKEVINGKFTELLNAIGLVADKRVPENKDGTKGHQANVIEKDDTTSHEQNSHEHAAFVGLFSSNVTAVHNQALEDVDVNDEPFCPTVSATTEERKCTTDSIMHDNSGVPTVLNCAASCEKSFVDPEVTITVSHHSALLDEIECQPTVDIENKTSDTEQRLQLEMNSSLHGSVDVLRGGNCILSCDKSLVYPQRGREFEMTDSEFNELIGRISHQATDDVADKTSVTGDHGPELETSGSESYTHIALIALPACLKVPSESDCKDYNTGSHDDNLFEQADKVTATAAKRRTIEKTPVVRQRCRRSAAVKESPFVSTWDSGASVIDISGGIVDAVSSPKKVVSKRFPFTGSITQHVDYNLECEFNDFVKKKKGESEKLDELFEFEVAEVSSKSWFRTLYTPKKDLNSSHLDVIFYYLRKKAKYALKMKLTTTDYHFHKIITQAYQDLTGSGEKKFKIEKYDNVIDYMLGFAMYCNTAWYNVDEVLCPVHDQAGWHWILARISMVDRCLYVYDSMRSPSHRESVYHSLQPYAVLLPLFLLSIDFYNKRDDIKLEGGRHKGKELADPYTIEYVLDLPLQDGVDCGAFVASFAEYIVEGIEIPKFDVHACRARFAVLLWKYGKDKQEHKEKSDSEDPGLNPERQGKHRRGKKRKK